MKWREFITFLGGVVGGHSQRERNRLTGCAASVCADAGYG